MKSLKNILEKVRDALPYFYFMTYGLILLLNQFIPVMRGNIWTSTFIFCITLVFLLQFIYRFKYLDLVLGILTLCGSVWMLIAAYSDFLNISPWTLNDIKVFIIVCFIIINFYASISLLTKKRQVNQPADNISTGLAVQHKKESVWKAIRKNLLFLARVDPKL